MENTLTINNKIFNYSEISYLKMEDKVTLLIMNIDNETIDYSIAIESCTAKDILSIYYYCTTHSDHENAIKGATNWFNDHVGISKLPQEYQFMLM